MAKKKTFGASVVCPLDPQIRYPIDRSRRDGSIDNDLAWAKPILILSFEPKPIMYALSGLKPFNC
jgi:hypothetical protein